MVITTCKVTLFHVPKVRVGNATRYAICGQPVVKYDLCAHHYADRVRMGGVA